MRSHGRTTPLDEEQTSRAYLFMLAGARVDYTALRDTTTVTLLFIVGLTATAGQLTMTKALFRIHHFFIARRR